MGLGKSLSLLALICWRLDVMDRQNTTEVNQGPQATLIVTPKSSIHQLPIYLARVIWPPRSYSWMVETGQDVWNPHHPICVSCSWLTESSSHIHHGKLRVSVYHGSERERLASELYQSDIVITTYETLRSDWVANGSLYSVKWLRLVLDEGQFCNT